MKLSILVSIALAACLPLLASADPQDASADTAAMAASAPTERSTQDDDLQEFSGRWLYVEDTTEGVPREEQGPPMMVTFGLRVEEDRVVLERARSEEPIPLDGSTIETAATGGRTKRVRGGWNDGTLVYESDYLDESDGKVTGLLRREFRITPEGLQVRVIQRDYGKDSFALYCHPEDIPLPTPAKATIADLAWLAGAWVGTRGSSSLEERWSPPGGGAMLGVSRTIRGDKMVAFEYLRVVERDGGLVYVAQPGGSSPTEFVLTELGTQRAVFENPRHDSPQRIVYELSAEGALSATIGFIHGGRGTRFEFTRQGD
ncbi:MAG: DUF6265 family protein [Planctomycetota bacterium]|nr:DUF6265 family protein [Planctomycetota bacterium]